MWVGLHCVTMVTGLFGEDPANRRERLRQLLSEQLERGELLEAVEEATIAATAVSHAHLPRPLIIYLCTG